MDCKVAFFNCPMDANAEPGLMTPGDLPLVFALENDLRLFLK